MRSDGITRSPRAVAATGVRQVLDPAIRSGEFLGAQIYAAVDGEPLVDLAIGDARVDGPPMTTETPVSWQCNTKPVTATVVAILWERGAVGLDDRVDRYLPGFGTNGKQATTVRHLLQHSAGFANDPPLSSLGRLSPEQVEAVLAQARLVEGWQPGDGELYSAWLGYSALGALVSRVSGRPFSAFVRDEVFSPLGMDDCWIGVDEDQVSSVADRMAFLYDTAGSQPTVPPIGGVAQGRDLDVASPASGGVGPVRQLARLYESFLGFEGVPRVLRDETLAAMTARTQDRRYGLGFEVQLGVFGTWCPTAFGHQGLRSSIVLADPLRRMVVALAVNGLGRGRNIEHLLGVGAAVRAALN